MTRKCVVITTIHPPSTTVRRLARRQDWRVIVAGDRKTPPDWSWPGVLYLSPEAQQAAGWETARLLPWDHYARKMVGYLAAMRQGAEVIADLDDDNFPYPSWDFPPFAGRFETLRPGRRFVNIYSLFSRKTIWPRGLPLDWILRPESRAARDELVAIHGQIGIWQGLADGDPDVDALYRLTRNRPCRFRREAPVVLPPGTFSPVNSQNSAFRRELFPLLYLPAHVSFRFTDILRGLVAQPLMWQAGFRLGVTTATVVQRRNPHGYLGDFFQEIPVYRHAEEAAAIALAAAQGAGALVAGLRRVYRELAAAKVVGPGETELLDAWCADLAALPGREPEDAPAA
jgi:hypothetical protein